MISQIGFYNQNIIIHNYHCHQVYQAGQVPQVLQVLQMTQMIQVLQGLHAWSVGSYLIQIKKVCRTAYTQQELNKPNLNYLT